MNTSEMCLDASSHLYIRLCPSDGWMDGPSVRPSVRNPFMLKMGSFHHENHWDSPTLTLVNVFGMLGVLKCTKQWVACQ